MILGTQGNLQALTGGLRLKVRIQHPGIHERTDCGESYWYFRYWDDVLQADGTTKAVRKFPKRRNGATSLRDGATRSPASRLGRSGACGPNGF
jgi:hypothetical protein